MVLTMDSGRRLPTNLQPLIDSMGYMESAKESAEASASSASAASASETNAAASEKAAAASQSAAKTSETNAQASETAAAKSQTAAATSASGAAVSASASASSASAAKASETNAKTSETNAAAPCMVDRRECDLPFRRHAVNADQEGEGFLPGGKVTERLLPPVNRLFDHPRPPPVSRELVHCPVTIGEFHFIQIPFF